MLSECLNPECRIPLHYLRGGRIVRTVHQEGACMRVEHFWLCGECSRLYDFLLLPGEAVTAIRRESLKSGQRILNVATKPEAIGYEHVKTDVSSARPTTPCRQSFADTFLSTSGASVA